MGTHSVDDSYTLKKRTETYPRMAQFNPNYNDIGTKFIEHFFTTFQTNREGLRNLYGEQSILSYEGHAEPIVGVDEIMKKYESLKFQSVAFQNANVTCQPLSSGSIIVYAQGDICIDGGSPLKFSETFVLTNNGGTKHLKTLDSSLMETLITS